MRKKVSRRAEATGEKREWPATEQRDIGADCGPAWALEGLGRDQGLKVLEQLSSWGTGLVALGFIQGQLGGRLSRVDTPHEHKRLLTLLLWFWSSIVIIDGFVFASGP